MAEATATVQMGEGRGGRIVSRGFAWAIVRSICNLATSLLISWGILTAILLAIGGFTLNGLMLHLANLSTRYLAADTARVASFHIIILVAQFVILACVLACRRHTQHSTGK